MYPKGGFSLLQIVTYNPSGDHYYVRGCFKNMFDQFRTTKQFR